MHDAGSQVAGRLSVVKVPLPDTSKEWVGWGHMELVECALVARPRLTPADQQLVQACMPAPGLICTPSEEVGEAAAMEGRQRAAAGGQHAHLSEPAGLPATGTAAACVADAEAGAACHVIGRCLCRPVTAQPRLVELVELGVAWLRQNWALVAAQLGRAAAAAGGPHGDEQALHFHMPGLLVGRPRGAGDGRVAPSHRASAAWTCR